MKLEASWRAPELKKDSEKGRPAVELILMDGVGVPVSIGLVDRVGVGVPHEVTGLLDGVPERMGVPKQFFIAVPETQTGGSKRPGSVCTQESVPKLPSRFVRSSVSKKHSLKMNFPPPRKCLLPSRVLFVITLSRITNFASDPDASKMPSYELVEYVNMLDRMARHLIHVDLSISSRYIPLGPEFDSIIKYARFKCSQYLYIPAHA
jgi:hypothetical protein